MRFLRVIPLIIAVAFIWALNHSFGSLPAIGKIIDPINGAMTASEDLKEDWNRSLQLKDLKAPVAIWMDTSLIPHIRADNDHDLYYAQGYIHAYFRLWQMDLQTRAAWGRISEVAGPKAIDFDRGMRREGMVWGAQHSLTTMEADPRTKGMLDAYRDGINAYIHTLNYRRLPIEYKLMGFVPEDWTNLRTALLMKYMARDLTGKTDDIAYTQLRDQLGQQEFDFLFPEKIKGNKPVIPEGTKFSAPSLPQPKVPDGDVWAHFGKDGATSFNATPRADEYSQRLCHSGGNLFSRSDCTARSKPLQGAHPLREHRFFQNDKVAENNVGQAMDWASSLHADMENAQSEIDEGSNNWAISGSHTASGKPILCNDPHLALNLPSLWYEMQLSAPGINAYGASLPGAPGIVIGFNEKISWGFTNNYRDVKDFYEITPEYAFPAVPSVQDEGTGGITHDYVRHLPRSYLFNGKRQWFGMTKEVIKVKGEDDVRDFVLYTIHGPVTYDPSFPPPDVGAHRVRPDNTGTGTTGTRGVPLLACTWMGHRGSNELLATYLLNRAGDYPAFTDAISHFECPAQNIAYADGAGNIAMWAQGRFINKWKGQGKYVMRGDDSATLWGDAIPWQENPHVLNPPQGYVASANQQVTDSTYPYWYNQSFTEWRSWEINRVLGNNDTVRLFDRNGNIKLVRASIPIAVIPDEEMRMFSHGNYVVLTEFQNDVRSLLQARISSLLYRDFKPEQIDGLLPPMHNSEDNFLPANQSHDLRSSNKVASVFQVWWLQLYKDIWQDEFPTATKYPSSELTVQLLLSDSTSKYYDDKRTQQVETLRDIVQRAFKETTDSLDKLKRTTGLEWYKVKNTSLTHLAKIPAFSYDHLKIGGWSNTINACTGDHGPSWRMIVEMDSIPRAYAIYPGGQSGNPGSPHYSDFIDQWVEGKYHEIHFLTAATTKNTFKYTWTLTP